MSSPPTPCVLVVADPGRIPEIAEALTAPFERGPIDLVSSTGGDDTIDLFAAREPEVVVVTASLEEGDAKSLIEAMRGMVPRTQVGIVLVGDDAGPIRTALDALELAPDRFVTRPLAANALRFAVQSCFEPVATARVGTRARTRTDRGLGLASVSPAQSNGNGSEGEGAAPTREALRARWEKLADSIGDDDADLEAARESSGAIAAPPIVIQPRRRSSSEVEPWLHDPPSREPTLIIRDPVEPPAAPTGGTEPSDPSSFSKQTTQDRWPLAPPAEPAPGEERWLPPLPLADLLSGPTSPEQAAEAAAPAAAGTGTDTAVRGDAAARADSSVREDTSPSARDRRPSNPALAIDFGGRGSTNIGDDEVLDDDLGDLGDSSGPHGDLRRLEDLVKIEPLEPDEPLEPVIPPNAAATPPPIDGGGGRDFARELRAKMSMMAQRLFNQDAGTPPAVSVAPRHDYKTEIDLAALGEEPEFGQGNTELEARKPADTRELTTSPGSWDTQVRERGLPDAGEIVRGMSDSAMLLARMFAQSATGRIGFRKDDVEKVVFFDQGRPVFASSNERGDRMGQLLVREGKITASQYERCQTHASTSGRRMGEILVDFGYLKRRELLPAVRRHVEDIVYSLFGWDSGHYRVHLDSVASGERIRMSRHPASLVLEGIRRKLDRSTLERLVGPPSTVVEVPDREKLGGIIAIGDLAPEERAALASFDGQADLVHVARAANVDVADLLPLAWGLCVLGLASARRVEADPADEQTALVGETDLAIDRERVRARWQLVTEADYFALLGVRHDATAFEIRRAYQSARRDFAADCFPTDLRRELARELDEIASVLDEAFRVLRDDRLRMTYLANLIE